MPGYTVDLLANTCTCMDWQYQGLRTTSRCCKHLSLQNGCARPRRLPRASSPPALQLLSTSTTGIAVGWYWSEKLDGIRVYWDGRRCVTREKGYLFDVPFALPPDIPLDGELLSTSGQDLALQIRRGLDHPGWKDVRYAVFDAPGCPGTWAQRQAFLGSLGLSSTDAMDVELPPGDVPPGPPGDVGVPPREDRLDVELPPGEPSPGEAGYARYVVPSGRPRRIAAELPSGGAPSGAVVYVVPQIPLEDKDLLQELGREVRRIARAGGEGVVVQNPEREYTSGVRDRTLAVKIKPYYSTLACRVGANTMCLPGRDCAFRVSNLSPGLEVGGECEVFFLRKTIDNRLVHASTKRLPPYSAHFHCPDEYAPT
jgi:hypothetical protein